MGSKIINLSFNPRDLEVFEALQKTELPHSNIHFIWKWMEKTRTYLLIFHFYPKKFGNFRVELDSLYLSVTWAPTHIEQGLIAELLSLANTLNGLRVKVRQEIRPFLTSRAYLTNASHDWDTISFPLCEKSVKYMKELYVLGKEDQIQLLRQSLPDWQLYGRMRKEFFEKAP